MILRHTHTCTHISNRTIKKTNISKEWELISRLQMISEEKKRTQNVSQSQQQMY